MLDVLDDEGLMANANLVGSYMQDRMAALRHPLLAETRGRGFFFGAEFVLNADMTPATAFAAEVVERMLTRGILLNRIGRQMNTIKMRPPMPFSRENADTVLDALTKVLAETPVPA